MYARNLSCEADGVAVLEGLNFDLGGEAKTVSFLGEADSGAAELALLLAGILPRMLLVNITGEFSGFFLPRDEVSSDHQPLAGYVAPDPADQIVGLSVEAELEWAWSRSRLTLASVPEDLKILLQDLDPESLSGRSTGRLSSGQKQRLAITSIAISDPELLVLDNCFSSLDHRSVSVLTRYIEQRAERGLATWIVGRPHLRVARKAAECVGFRTGRVTWVETADEVHQPKDSHRIELESERRASLYDDLASAIEAYCRQSRLHKVFRLDVADLYLPSELGDRPRLDIPHLTAEPGEIAGVRGDNGSGKSSLLSALAGLEKLPRGQLLWGETNAEDRRLCYLPPDGLPAWIAKLGRAELWPLAPERTPLTALCESLLQQDRYAPIADGSYRSRENPWRRLWWIASSIHADVGWLLMDEPTTGMDNRQEECMKRMVLAHAGRGGGGLLVSHDHDFLLAACRRLITVAEGQITQDSRSSVAAAG